MIALLLALRRVALALAVAEDGTRRGLARVGAAGARTVRGAGGMARRGTARGGQALRHIADHLALGLMPAALAAAGLEDRLARNPAGRLVRRVHGQPRPDALPDGLGDLARWIRTDRVIPVVLLWGAGLAAVLAAGGPAVTSQAAQATYLLLALVGLHLLTVDTAQPSLGQAAFLAVGAYLTAVLRNRLGLGGVEAALVAGLLTAAVGFVVGFGAARLRPAFVALATWAFGWLVAVGIDALPQVSGGSAGIGLGGPMELRLGALGVDLRFGTTGHLLLGTALVALALVALRSAERSTVGMTWAAMRDSAALARALGYDVASHRRWTFFAAAGLAGLAGSLSAQAVGIVDPTSYTATVSLSLFVAVLIGSPFGVLGPFAGLAVARGLPALVEAGTSQAGLHLGQENGIVTALLTVAALVLALGGDRAERWRRRHSRRAPAAPAANDGAAVTIGVPEAGAIPVSGTTAADPNPAGAPGQARRRHPARPTPGARPALEVRALTKRFGGVHALDLVDLQVPTGEIHGLVGPNGSGKSTLLRCLSGTLPPDGGSVILDGRWLDHLDETGRVAAGIVRTFQRTVVLPGLTVAEHVELGLARRSPGSAWGQALAKTPGYREGARARRAAALALLRQCGLVGSAEAEPEALSSGRQRLLQLVTAAAGGPSVLLLDEPAAGMRPDELELLERTIRQLAEYGLTLLVVEHNLRFLSRVVDRMTVLREGQVIATGRPQEIAADPHVRHAYLGSGRLTSVARPGPVGIG